MKLLDTGYVQLEEGESLEKLPIHQLKSLMDGPTEDYKAGLEMLQGSISEGGERLKDIILPIVAHHNDNHYDYALDEFVWACQDLGILTEAEVLEVRKNHTQVMAAINDPQKSNAQMARLRSIHRKDLAA